jgi:predicted kinase
MIEKQSPYTPTCTVMVGLPALGKTYFIDRIKNDNTWIYSTDMYIDAVAEDNGITYSEAFASNIKAATEFNEQKLKTMMSLKRDIIWDQTNLGEGKRKKIISRMKEGGYIINCVCLMPPSDDVQRTEHDMRLKNRVGKNIPDHVLSNMLETFTAPQISEGFARIYNFDMFGDLINIMEHAYA